MSVTDSDANDSSGHDSTDQEPPTDCGFALQAEREWQIETLNPRYRAFKHACGHCLDGEAPPDGADVLRFGRSQTFHRITGRSA
jgi:hypothetical protein